MLSLIFKKKKRKIYCHYETGKWRMPYSVFLMHILVLYMASRHLNSRTWFCIITLLGGWPGHMARCTCESLLRTRWKVSRIFRSVGVRLSGVESNLVAPPPKSMLLKPFISTSVSDSPCGPGGRKSNSGQSCWQASHSQVSS